MNNNYRRFKVEAGKETHVEAQAHGDAGVQLHPWGKVHTPRQCVHASVPEYALYMYMYDVSLSP